MFRKSCGTCHFTNLQRPSDITLADFWGWQKTDKDINIDNKGVSLVFVNTKKGQELFNAVKDRMHVIPAKLEDCIQPQLQHPVDLNPLSEAFAKDYINKGFEYTYHKYNKGEKRQLRIQTIKRIWHMIKRVIKKSLIVLNLYK